MPRRAMRMLSTLLATAVIGASLAGCGLRIPSDPEGTLDRVTDGVLRVGASPGGDLVRVAGENVSGPLVDLVEGFAEDRGAEVTWTVGGEEELVDSLESGGLDLAIGGMTDATPWADRVSVTRGYDGIPGAGQKSVVMLLPMGENALQSALESYLDERLGKR